MSNGPGGDLTEGIRLLQTGDLSSAAAFFARAVQAAPADGQAFGYLGITFARLGDMEHAIPALYESARLQPTDAAAHYNFALGLMQVQRTQEARSVLERTLALNPGHAQARAALDSLGPVTPAPTAPGGYAPQPGVQPLNPEAVPEWSAANPAPPVAPMSPPPIYPPAYSAASSATAGGMMYHPAMAQNRPTAIPPSLGLRLARGLGWGALYGQWWTLWNVFWGFVWGMGGSRPHEPGFVVLVIVVVAIFFALVGAVAGLIIGAIDAEIGTGAIIGVVFGMLMLGIEFLITPSPTMVINIFFWFYTGRYVGGNVAARVRRPVQP